MRAYFETASGETIPLPDPMSPEQSAIVYLTGGTGIRRIDDETIDEFVRRADLYDTYIGGINLRDIETGEKVPVTRQIITEAMAGHPALWTNAGLVTPEAFDRMIRVAKAAL
ncbi:MAG: hypothetical protein ACRDQ0_06190 [Pseudonocardia sp.]